MSHEAIIDALSGEKPVRLPLLLERLFASRLWALILKEIGQIRRNRQLIILLIVPPTIQLLVYGFALNPDVRHLQLGVSDYARTELSRELVARIVETGAFDLAGTYASEQQLARDVETGRLTAGLVIPPELPRQWARGETAELQLLLDGVDANSAGIARGYLQQTLARFARQRSGDGPPLLQTEPVFLYNPGLVSSWFFVPGVMGLVLTLVGSLASSQVVVREKDSGTLEQLLMAPAADWEILLAKIVPLVVLLLGDVLLALTLGRLVFGVPFNGSLLLFLLLSLLYLAVAIAIGILLATLCRSQQQVVLLSFFINLPLIQTSGSIAPIEAMPAFFQAIATFNPLRHYVAIVRGILLRGVGLGELWPHTLALLLAAGVLLGISTRQFRRQLN